LLAGNTGAYRDRVATILVEQLPPVIAALEAAGAQIIEAPRQRPTMTVSSPGTLTARSSSTSGQAPSKGLAAVAMRVGHDGIRVRLAPALCGKGLAGVPVAFSAAARLSVTG
jgi:hypothetical protein